MFERFTYPKLIHLKEFIGRITIVLYLLVSKFLTVIYLLHFLSLKKICSTDVFMKTKTEVMNGYKGLFEAIIFSWNDDNKSVLQK